MSADQDYYQLLRDPDPGRGPVRVLNTARRPGSRPIGPSDVAARYGVTPAQHRLPGTVRRPVRRHPGVRGIGAKTAAKLLGLATCLEELPATGRLADRRGLAVTAKWEQVNSWRSMIRMRANLSLATAPCGEATDPMPGAGQVIARLGLWQPPPCLDARPGRSWMLWLRKMARSRCSLRSLAIPMTPNREHPGLGRPSRADR